MDFARKLDQAQNLSDLFELVKRAVEAVLGRTRAGLMLALADLGNHPQGFLGAFYPVASNVIVMNKVPLLRIQETNPNLYKPYYELGISLEELDDQQHALERYTQCIQHNPRFVPCYTHLGALYQDLSYLEQAVQV